MGGADLVESDALGGGPRSGASARKGSAIAARSIDPSAWDTFVAAAPGDLLPQTTLWAQTKSPACEYDVVALFEGNRIVGGCMVLKRRLGLMDVFYAPRGPLLLPGYEQAANLLLTHLIDRIHQRRPYALVLQPAVESEILGDALAKAGFGRAPADIVPSATVEVDLRRDVEAIQAGMRSSRRRNIRKAERAGVQMRRGDWSDLETFHALHSLTAKRQDFDPMSIEYLRSQWDTLGRAGVLRLYLTEIDGAPLSAATVSAFGDRMVFRLAGLADDPRARQLRASDYLHWKILSAAKEEQFAFYDLGGFDRSAAVGIEAGDGPPDRLRDSPAQFKLGFGGRVVSLPEAQWLLSPSALRFSQATISRLFRSVPQLQAVVGRIRAA